MIFLLINWWGIFPSSAQSCPPVAHNAVTWCK